MHHGRIKDSPLLNDSPQIFHDGWEREKDDGGEERNATSGASPTRTPQGLTCDVEHS